MFQVGFARVDITPPLGSNLAGYFRIRPADHILDPVELNCIAFSDGENKAVLITGDLLYVMENVATPLRQRIGKECDIPADHVFTQGLHQHTSLRIGTRPYVWGPGFNDQEYLDVLNRKYVDVAKLALRDLKDAVLYQGEAQALETVSFVRRIRMKDGTVRTNPKRADPNIDDYASESDNTVRLLRFKREEGGDVALVNFSSHPDCIGGTGISADWPGFVRRMMEAEYPGTHCILVNGAQGDTAHVDYKVALDPTKKRDRYAESAHIGRVITDTVKTIWDTAKPMETGRIWGKSQMSYIRTNTKGIDKIEEYKELQRKINAKEIPEPSINELGEISRITVLERETLFQNVPASVLMIGKAGFVGFGGEPFTRYATNAREDGKDFYIITACLANGGQGYLPTREAFEEGGYEARSSRFAPDVEDILRKSAADMMDEYRNLK